jgi:hypothetical protein
MLNLNVHITKEDIVRDRQGCLAGLLELFLLDRLFNWLQRRFGFGRGCSCGGLGCGVILLVLFLIFACSIVGGTNWLHLIR